MARRGYNPTIPFPLAEEIKNFKWNILLKYIQTNQYRDEYMFIRINGQECRIRITQTAVRRKWKVRVIFDWEDGTKTSVETMADDGLSRPSAEELRLAFVGSALDEWHSHSPQIHITDPDDFPDDDVVWRAA